MNLFYAVGGGLGHITRTITLMNNLHIPVQEVILLSNSTYARAPFIPKQLQVIAIQDAQVKDLAQYQKFLVQLIRKFHIQQVFLDAFPAGILGEWNSFPKSKELVFNYIARILKWDFYSGKNLQEAPYFQKTYILEPLQKTHQEFIQKHSQEIYPFNLKYLQSTISSEVQNSLQKLKKDHQEIWLIIHSEPDSEIEQLYHYARDTAALRGISPKFLLITQGKFCPPDTIPRADIYPVYTVFPLVDRIISACGFNIIHQTSSFRDKHIFLPFPRKYDDQYLRAKLIKEGTI